VRRTPGYRSRNVDDRRHRAAGGRGGASLLPLLFLLGRSRIGLLAILLIGGLLWLGGVDPLMLLTGGGAPASRVTPARDAAEAEMVDLVNVVFDDLQATWGRLLAGGGPAYREATLVLFRDAVESACGFAQSASGPFYCPGDEQIYIDLGFYEELRRGLGAPGDFAQAYVLAHEVGHHVQNVLGIEREVRALQRGRHRRRSPPAQRGTDRQPGLVHPWIRRAARVVAASWLRGRRAVSLRHLRRRRVTPPRPPEVTARIGIAGRGRCTARVRCPPADCA
jgi:predicted metalloprotease